MSNPGLTDLQCYWKLDELSGSRYDEMNRVSLAQAGGVGYTTGHQIFTGNAADFVAANSERLWTTDPNDYLQGGDFPICFGLWIYVHDFSTNPIIFSKWGSDPNEEYELVLTNSKVMWVIKDENSDFYTVTAENFGPLSSNKWYFVGCYFDSVANEIGVCVNDIWDTDSVGIYGIDGQDANFIVGSWVPLTGFYDGYMDEMFAYWERLLTSAEWTWLYNNGLGRRFEDVSQVAPPVIDVATIRQMPEIYVYDQNLNGLGLIDTYSSLNWAERYDSEGDFELELPLSYADDPLLAFGNFLYIGTSDKIMIIEERKPTKSSTDGKLLINGRSAESILRRRELMTLQNFTGETAENLMYSRVYWSVIFGAGDADRIIDIFEDGSGDTWPPAMESSAPAFGQYETESIYEVIEALAKAVNLGFKVVVPNLASASSKLYFFVYDGLDRSSNVIFSENFDNLMDSSFLTTEKDRVNLTVVFTDDEAYSKVWVWEGSEPTGLNRFEGRLDTTIDRGGEEEVSESKTRALTNPTLGIAGRVSLVALGITVTPTMGLKSTPPEPLTDKEVLAIIEERGETVIKENTPVAVFEGDIDPRTQFVLGEDFFLGDIVQVNAHGISDKGRIIEVLKSYSAEGEKISVTFDFEV